MSSNTENKNIKVGMRSFTGYTGAQGSTGAAGTSSGTGSTGYKGHQFLHKFTSVREFQLFKSIEPLVKVRQENINIACFWPIHRSLKDAVSSLHLLETVYE